MAVETIQLNYGVLHQIMRINAYLHYMDIQDQYNVYIVYLIQNLLLVEVLIKLLNYGIIKLAKI